MSFSPGARTCILFRFGSSSKVTPAAQIFARNKAQKPDYSPDRKTFIDYKKVSFKAGNGGHGCMSMMRNANMPKMGPAGGDGGRGGSIYLETDHNIRCLKEVDPQYKGMRGDDGQGCKHRGGNADDITVTVPVGTIVRDHTTKQVVCELNYDKERYCLVRGGYAGVGNMAFKSSVCQRPGDSIEGGPGDFLLAEIEMKIIADIGLVGFPNAGKSSFLRAVSKARPKVAAYPFTTLHPHIGQVMYPDEDMLRIPVADIPGLIKGAHENKGLGHAFLKHIERCEALLFVIDISMGPEYAMTQYDDLAYELEMYKEGLSKQPAAVIASKMDISTDVPDIVKTLRSHTGLPVQACSSVTHTRIFEVKQFLRRFKRTIQEKPKSEKPPAHTILGLDGRPSIVTSMKFNQQRLKRPKEEESEKQDL